MELTHKFVVPAAFDVVWGLCNDIEAVAGCFPGASVTSVTDEEFRGVLKVKLGAISMAYAGTARLVKRHKEDGSLVIEARARDERGNGSAIVVVSVTMAGLNGSTAVTVSSDLAITGKPAQFGRAVIQDVSDRLLSQFVQRVQEQMLDSARSTTATDEKPAGSSAGSQHPNSPQTASSNDREGLALGGLLLMALLRTHWLALALVSLMAAVAVAWLTVAP